MSKQHGRRWSSPGRVVVIALAFVSLTLVTAGAIPATANTVPRKHHGLVMAAGTFLGHPFNITNVVPDSTNTTATFDATGGDEWFGDVAGTTTYEGSGTIDLTTGEVFMTLTDTFRGSVNGLGTGQIVFADYIHVGPGGTDPVATSTAIGGRGALRGITGGLGFTTTSVDDPDQYGNGTSHGTYEGFLSK